jgi:hypothetical protein
VRPSSTAHARLQRAAASAPPSQAAAGSAPQAQAAVRSTAGRLPAPPAAPGTASLPMVQRSPAPGAPARLADPANTPAAAGADAGFRRFLDASLAGMGALAPGLAGGAPAGVDAAGAPASALSASRAGAGAAPDLDALVERACARVLETLLVEQERRGVTPWL